MVKVISLRRIVLRQAWACSLLCAIRSQTCKSCSTDMMYALKVQLHAEFEGIKFTCAEIQEHLPSESRGSELNSIRLYMHQGIHKMV